MRIAILSDIHGAYAPFQSALTAARKCGFDKLVILGDLLTYGIDPVECCELAAQALVKDQAILVAGNHDQIYKDLEDSRTSYLDRVPRWVAESVQWTWDQIGQRWPNNLPMVEEWKCDNILFAHANPFGYGNWAYLRTNADLCLAAEKLVSRNIRAGIFGHSHRFAHLSSPDADVTVVGAIGQPRNQSKKTPEWTLLQIEGARIELVRHDISFDSSAHRAAIHATVSLTQETRNKLCEYFI